MPISTKKHRMAIELYINWYITGYDLFLSTYQLHLYIRIY